MLAAAGLKINFDIDVQQIPEEACLAINQRVALSYQ
jgi:hypothetical protein